MVNNDETSNLAAAVDDQFYWQALNSAGTDLKRPFQGTGGVLVFVKENDPQSALICEVLQSVGVPYHRLVLATSADLARYYRIVGPPTTLKFDSNGHELGRLVGPQTVNRLTEWLANHKRKEWSSI